MTMTSFVFAIFALISLYSLLPPVEGARILGIFPSPSKSHLLIHSSVAETLAADGHNVTVIATFPNLLKTAKYRYLHVDSKKMDSGFTNAAINNPQPFVKQIAQFLEMVFDTANDTMNHEKMKDFLRTQRAGDFDLVILGYFMNDFMLGLGAHFRCPIVISFMVQPILPINEMIGNPLEVSYVPSLLMDIRPPMTFWPRLMNFLAIGIERLMMGNIMAWKNNQMYSSNIWPAPTKSHMLIHCAVANTLAEAGHQVTVLATLPNVYQQAKYKYIHIESSTNDDEFTTSLVNDAEPAYKRFHKLLETTLHKAYETLNHPTLRELLRTHKAGDFDLMIYGYFINDFGLGLAGHFRCPIVISFMIQTIYPLNKLLGNPSEMSYVPTLFSGFQQPLDFGQRLANYLAIIMEQGIWAPWIYALVGDYYNYNFPADRYPPLDEVYKNVSLVLTNHHFSQGPIRPNVPALIEIGGIQIKERPDPLPEDLAQIMDSADKGIIYFSLGTNVQGSNLSKDKAKMIFNVLSQLPYTVLMKWSDSEYPGYSKNIHYKAWLPQDDILAHPNVKMFITHGGQGSVVEAQYHGVPMVGIPFFGDQNSNMANVKKSGFGLSLDYATLTEHDLRAAVLDVLNNPAYRENVQQFSKLYRDRPMTPRQLVRYWVDYVIRHKGAKHLQSPAVYMSWWQLNSVDVIAFLLAIVSCVVGIFVVMCRFLCCRRKKASTTKPANKQATKPATKAKKNK